VYYAARGGFLALLLCGGDKRTQRKDIELALALKKTLE
jgi:putative addiction module killer protein